MRNTTIPISHHRCGIRALIQIHQTERGLLALSVVQALQEAAFPYIELYDSARIIDLVIEGNFPAAGRNIALLAILICIAGLGLDAGNGLHAYLSNRAQRNMLRRISQKAMELDYEEMEDTGLLHQISDAFYTMNHVGGYHAFISYYQQLCKNLIQIAISVGAVLHLSMLPTPEGNTGWFAWVASPAVSLGILALVTVGNFLFSQTVAVRFQRYSSSGYQKKIKVERTLNYFSDKVFMNREMGKEIRLFHMLELILKKHGKALEHSIRFYNRYYDDAAKNQETLYLSSQGLCTLAAYFVVICKVLSGAVSVGELSQYIGTIVLFHQALRTCVAVNQKIALQTEFITTFQNFMQVKSKKASGGIPVPKTPGQSYCIEFHHVSYRYPGTEVDALKDISCRITSRTKAAVVGKNGAGKTTFVKLLCRLYEPTEGKITLNGVDILTRAQVVDEIVRNRAAGRTMLISTHLVDELDPYIDYAIYMKHGVIELMGSREELREKGSLTDLYLQIYGQHSGTEANENA